MDEVRVAPTDQNDALGLVCGCDDRTLVSFEGQSVASKRCPSTSTALVLGRMQGPARRVAGTGPGA